jgi:Domain of unknown function (DUF4214)
MSDGSPVRLSAAVQVTNWGSGPVPLVSLRMTVDGAPVGDGGHYVGLQNDYVEVPLEALVTGLAAGTHTVALQAWDGTPGTAIRIDSGSTITATGHVQDPQLSFVELLYHSVLNRAGSPVEVNNWVLFLNSPNASRTQVAQAFWESPEHRGIQVDGLYRGYLHRTESAAEQTAWVSFLENGGSELEIARMFLKSPEYQGEYADNSPFIESLYQTVLGRTASVSELANWLAFLQSGGTRDQAEVDFLTSLEHYKDIVDNYYSALLDRGASTGEEGAWTNFLRAASTAPNGVPQAVLDQFAETILASDEFFARASMSSS